MRKIINPSLLKLFSFSFCLFLALGASILVFLFSWSDAISQSSGTIKFLIWSILVFIIAIKLLFCAFDSVFLIYYRILYSFAVKTAHTLSLVAPDGKGSEIIRLEILNIDDSPITVKSYGFLDGKSFNNEGRFSKMLSAIHIEDDRLPLTINTDQTECMIFKVQDVDFRFGFEYVFYDIEYGNGALDNAVTRQLAKEGIRYLGADEGLLRKTVKNPYLKKVYGPKYILEGKDKFTLYLIAFIAAIFLVFLIYIKFFE